MCAGAREEGVPAVYKPAEQSAFVSTLALIHFTGEQTESRNMP